MTKKKILTRNEVLEMLSNIARGKTEEMATLHELCQEACQQTRRPCNDTDCEQ